LGNAGMRIKGEILQRKVHSQGGVTKTKTKNKHTIKFELQFLLSGRKSK
jgi:hypothetical protein